MMVFRWRKSSYSGGNGECVELGIAEHPSWRKSSYSGGNGACVELSAHGAVRDSKNPTGPLLRADLTPLIHAIRTETIHH